MSRKYSTGVTALVLAVCAVQAAAEPAVPCPAGLTAAAAAVAALRGLPASFSPPCRVISRPMLEIELDRKLHRDLPIAPELFLEALARLGFIPESGPAVYDSLLDFYGSQVLGFYEPESDEMVLVDGASLGSSGAALVWAHELAHAAQEHRFGLPSRLLAMSDNGDAQRAASAIAEGEGMLVMFFLGAPANQREETALHQADGVIHGQGAMEALITGVPEYFVKDLLFPYTAGLAEVVRGYRAGGWPAVDRLLEQPPASTAALLHPDRAGTPRTVPDAVLPEAPAGWQPVLTDTLGEWGLTFWLSRCSDTAEAERVAAAWDGDRIRIIRAETDASRWGLAWRLQVRAGERSKVESALRSCLPTVLAGVSPASRSFEWSRGDDWIDVRVGWPARARPPATP